MAVGHVKRGRGEGLLQGFQGFWGRTLGKKLEGTGSKEKGLGEQKKKGNLRRTGGISSGEDRGGGKTALVTLEKGGKWTRALA